MRLMTTVAALAALCAAMPAFATAPKYGFCWVPFNYDPPRYKDYHNVIFFSAELVDTQPDVFAHGATGLTVQQARLVDAVTKYGRAMTFHYTNGDTVNEPTSVDEPRCFAYDTPDEETRGFQAEFESRGNEAHPTGVGL